MSEFKESVEQIRLAMLRVRPLVRPYVLAAAWVFIAASVVMKVRMYLKGRPIDWFLTIQWYVIVIGFLVFEAWADRCIRKQVDGEKKAEED